MKNIENQQPLFSCPCCGEKCLSEIGGYEICDNCGWEDDPVQREYPMFSGGANDSSLFQAREYWSSINKDYKNNK